MYTITTYFN